MVGSYSFGSPDKRTCRVTGNLEITVVNHLRAENNKLNVLWPKMARLGPPFGPKIPPERVYVVRLRPFPGNKAHKLFSWAQNRKLCAFSVP